MATFWTPDANPRTVRFVRGPDGRFVNLTATYGVPIDTGTDDALARLIRASGADLREQPILGPINYLPNPGLGVDLTSWSTGAFNGGAITSALTRVTGQATFLGFAAEFSFTLNQTAGSQAQIYPGYTAGANVIPAAAGDVFSAEYWVQVVSGGSQLLNIQPNIGAKTDTGTTFLGQSFGTGSYPTTFTVGYQQVTRINAVMPATTGMVYPAIVFAPNATADGVTPITVRVATCMLHPGATLAPWPIAGYRPYNAWFGTVNNSPSYHFV